MPVIPIYKWFPRSILRKVHSCQGIRCDRAWLIHYTCLGPEEFPKQSCSSHQEESKPQMPPRKGMGVGARRTWIWSLAARAPLTVGPQETMFPFSEQEWVCWEKQKEITALTVKTVGSTFTSSVLGSSSALATRCDCGHTPSHPGAVPRSVVGKGMGLHRSLRSTV